MSTAADMVALYTQAEADILAHGQSSAIEGRSLTTADLAEVRAGRLEWEQRAAAEGRAAAGRGGMGYSVARFDGQ